VSRRRRRAPAALAVATALVLLVTVPAAVVVPAMPPAQAMPVAAGCEPSRCYRPPVDAPILDPFRPPADPWEPGNRGIEWATAPGTPVVAIGPGEVTFAGPVAGSLHVTVRPPDGLRSSYSFVAAIRVRVGERVRGGQVVAVAGATVHLGVRRGDRYLAPASLWGRSIGGRVRLVPSDPAPGRAPPPRARRVPRWWAAVRARPPPHGAGRRLGASPWGRLRSSLGPPRGGPTPHLRPEPSHGRRPSSLVRRSGTGSRPTAGKRENTMSEPVVSMKQLLDAGVHFGHQTRRWNPKMKRFIFGERNGIYIIDLRQTLQRIEAAYIQIRDTVADGGTVLFVGTKKQAQDPVQSYAEKSGSPYVNQRWLGGMLTNFDTMAKRVAKMKEYRRMRDSGEFEAMPKKEALLISRELEKLERNLGGIAKMDKLPDLVFILDTRKEHIAVTEANKLGIPIVAVVDTNCAPDVIQFPIPGNDDAIRSGTLMARVIADAVEEGHLIASRRPGATSAPRERSAEEEAAIAAQQADARRQAAEAAAAREARIAAAQQAATDAPEPAATEAPEAPAAEAPATETPEAPAAETTEESTPDA